MTCMRRGKRALWALSALATLAIGGACSASAETLVPGSWTVFDFLTPQGSTLYADSGGFPTSDATFTTGLLTQSADLLITDAYIPGDMFQLTIDNNAAPTPVTETLSTSTPPCAAASDCGSQPSLIPSTDSDWTTAYSSGEFSTGTLLLQAGFDYTITGITLTDATSRGAGKGALELEVLATPLPSSWTLLLAGFAGTLLLFWRRHRPLRGFPSRRAA